MGLDVQLIQIALGEVHLAVLIGQIHIGSIYSAVGTVEVVHNALCHHRANTHVQHSGVDHSLVLGAEVHILGIQNLTGFGLQLQTLAVGSTRSCRHQIRARLLVGQLTTLGGRKALRSGRYCRRGQTACGRRRLLTCANRRGSRYTSDIASEAHQVSIVLGVVDSVCANTLRPSRRETTGPDVAGIQLVQHPLAVFAAINLHLLISGKFLPRHLPCNDFRQLPHIVTFSQLSEALFRSGLNFRLVAV